MIFEETGAGTVRQALNRGAVRLAPIAPLVKMWAAINRRAGTDVSR